MGQKTSSLKGEGVRTLGAPKKKDVVGTQQGLNPKREQSWSRKTRGQVKSSAHARSKSWGVIRHPRGETDSRKKRSFQIMDKVVPDL